MRWQLQQAKQGVSEVVRRADGDGAQVVTRRGRDVAVIAAARGYRRPTGRGDVRAVPRGGPELDKPQVGRSPEAARRVRL